MENPRNLTTVVGNAVSLSCVPPTSFPIQVTIHWYHHYQQIVSGDGISIDSSGTIKFTSIRKSDEGMYFCDGTNSIVGVTRTSLQAYVTVHGKHICWINEWLLLLKIIIILFFFNVICV